MAKRLDDEDRWPGDEEQDEDRGVARRHPEVAAAEFEAEQPARELSGLPKLIISTAAVAVSLYALLWVVRPQPAQPYRTTFLAVTLAMTLLAYRPLARGRGAPEEERAAGGDNPGPLDWALAALAVVSLVYPLLVFDDFARRVVRPTGLDVVLGVVATLLVLEATRRTVGWVLPAICLAFVAYAFFGGFLPFGWELGHKGYDLERLVGQTYMGIEGIFGVPLDVAATYIVLFTIYGAVLEYSGAGRFFIDVSFAAFGTRSAAAPGGGRHQAAGLAAAALRLLLQLAGPDRGVHGLRAVAVPGRAVRDRGRLRPGVPAPRDPLDAPAGVRLPGRRHPRGPAGGGGVRRRRDHRGRGLAHRPGPQGQLADRRRRRRHPGPGGRLLGGGRGPVRLRAQPQRPGAAAAGTDPGHRLDPGRGRGGGCRPGRGHRRLAAGSGPAARAGPGRPGRAAVALPGAAEHGRGGGSAGGGGRGPPGHAALGGAPATAGPREEAVT
jgi:Tripartite ATP-independent periplasmic transporter, DctM component